MEGGVRLRSWSLADNVMTVPFSPKFWLISGFPGSVQDVHALALTLF
jgi:hypothetical protein